MKFVGIDLAWSDQNPSGVAVIGSDGTLDRVAGDIASNEDICDFARLNGSQDAVVAIDAPLIVKSDTFGPPGYLI